MASDLKERQAGAIEVTPEMVEVLSDWLADSVETGINPGKYETKQIIHCLLEFDRTRNRYLPEVSEGK